MTGVHIILGALAGAALGLDITAARLWLVDRLAGPEHGQTAGTTEPAVPPSRHVPEAERRHPQPLIRHTTPRRSTQ